tara:strand:- start:1002 stop:2234 length:1233 start_codon:yes stop_codon:yes gene_type:complete
MRIDRDRWDQAQVAEANDQITTTERQGNDLTNSNFDRSYKIIARYLDFDHKKDLKDKVVVEIGGGPKPALLFTDKNVKRSILVEPSGKSYPDYIREDYKNNNIELIDSPYEDADIGEVDETWFFNVLQHVLDPKEQLEKAKRTSKIVRIFEPINTETNLMHPHSLTEELFTSVFGKDFGQVFIGMSEPNFHSVDCYYGVWDRDAPESIDDDRWESAQLGELQGFVSCESNQAEVDGIGYAVDVMLNKHMGMDLEKDFVGKVVLESGGGKFPAISFVKGLERAINVEPLYDKLSDFDKNYQEEKNIEVIVAPFEDIDCEEGTVVDEVWFFNVLQHVKSPGLQIEKAKSMAKTIRLFEPILTPVNNEHPWSFTLEWFEEYFPGLVKEFVPEEPLKYKPFFGCRCAYLVWNKD